MMLNMSEYVLSSIMTCGGSTAAIGDSEMACPIRSIISSRWRGMLRDQCTSARKVSAGASSHSMSSVSDCAHTPREPNNKHDQRSTSHAPC